MKPIFGEPALAEPVPHLVRGSQLLAKKMRCFLYIKYLLAGQSCGSARAAALCTAFYEKVRLRSSVWQRQTVAQHSQIERGADTSQIVLTSYVRTWSIGLSISVRYTSLLGVAEVMLVLTA